MFKIQFWTSKTEEEALNTQRNPKVFDVASKRFVQQPSQHPMRPNTYLMEFMSSNRVCPDFTITSHHQPPVPGPPQDASGSHYRSNNASINEDTTTMQTQFIPRERPVTQTPTYHRVSKAKKGKRIYACGSPGCGKVCGMIAFLLTLSMAHFSPLTGHCIVPIF